MKKASAVSPETHQEETWGSLNGTRQTGPKCFVFMPPNFDEVDGAYWFGPVCACVRYA